MIVDFGTIAAIATAPGEAGIAVILDMVLNHTGESDVEGTTLSLRGLDNALYYRHAIDDPVRTRGQIDRDLDHRLQGTAFRSPPRVPACRAYRGLMA